MQEAGSSSTSSLFRNDPQCPASIISGVTTSCPVKRITFFRSGDAQFNGVRMAIHTRNFKCFDALLDDLSQKVPLPFGVRTITTPRGTHAIRRLEQLKDGGCYICSDRRYVKPVNVEAAGRRPTIWLKSDTHNSWKKPTRPEEPPVAHSGLQYHWHPKRIILVRNTDPAMRRSITLSRRMAQSLRMFMDDVSKVMQCQVRKLYTLDGRKVISLSDKSELTLCKLESFNFLLPETLEMPAKDKMPGMSTQSRFSDCSEGQKSKRNGTA
uniref:Doublecortin domain-containing protein n=1 Tax=Electrophorus electricus TaxID=8005 RepID=A0A4W4F772_ELEEL